MEAVLKRYWWMFAVRGGFAVLYGLAAVVMPRLTLGVLIVLFGVFALANGIFAVGTALAARKEYEKWWVLLLEGAAGVIVGIGTIAWPQLTAVLLLFLIAGWAVATGILEILAGLAQPKEVGGDKWVLVLGGVISLLFGIFLFAQPGKGALAILWMIGVFAIVAGVVLITIGFRLKGMKTEE